MSEREDIRELANMLKGLPKNERLKIKGVVVGVKLAYKNYIDSLKADVLTEAETIKN